MFCAITSRDAIEAFKPTIFTFSPDGFTRVRNGQYVSWSPQRAVSCETLVLVEALATWNIQVCYVADLDALIAMLTRAGVVFDEQTG